MKLIDFLKIKDENTFSFLRVGVCGMQFEAGHIPRCIIDDGNELNGKKIMEVYITDGNLHVRLNDQA